MKTFKEKFPSLIREADEGDNISYESREFDFPTYPDGSSRLDDIWFTESEVEKCCVDKQQLLKVLEYVVKRFDDKNDCAEGCADEIVMDIKRELGL